MMSPAFVTALVDFGIKHHSAGGVYMREQQLEAGKEVDKHLHPYDHLSFLCSGSAIVEVDGELKHLEGPCAIEIRAGKQHRIQAVTDIVWLCIHAESVADPEIIVKE
ncbi:cupin domain-containing protein [Paraburkholderia sp. D1E]|uniref:cupin domain-containing protein n=1 Tax=Paraburkholderia sp. D1E TaxID=3461398 RepID=UPI0040463294